MTSKGSNQTARMHGLVRGHSCKPNIYVSWSISELRVRLARHDTSLSPSVKYFWLTVPRRYFFCGSFELFMSCVCHAFASVHYCVVVTWRKGWPLGSCLWCILWFCYFPIRYPVFDCIDSWSLLSFLLWWSRIPHCSKSQVAAQLLYISSIVNT